MIYYVEFVYPGIIVNETSHTEISEKDWLRPDMVKIPKGSFGFRFVSRSEVVINGEKLVGEYRVASGWYFVGKKMSRLDVAKEKGRDNEVYKNMIYTELDHVVKTKGGQYIPVEKGDVVL